MQLRKQEKLGEERGALNRGIDSHTDYNRQAPNAPEINCRNLGSRHFSAFKRCTLCRLWSGAAVASFAGCRGGFVEEHQVASYLFFERVARRTGDIFMAALERKPGLFMIEERWTPLGGVVAIGAAVGTRAELVGMRILVAITAIHGGFCEVHVAECQFHVRRFVALNTGGCTMGAEQGKVSFPMIERCSVLPIMRGVTCFASQRPSCFTE